MPLERIAGTMRGYSEFYDDYLIKKKTPGEVIKAKPNLAELWYDQPDHQYGRPATFYQQLEDLDLLGAWAKVDAPVLAIHGEYDWIMSREDHEIIAALGNRNHPGNGKFVELSKTNHLLFSYASPQEAFKNASSGRYNPSATSAVLEFLRTQQ
jgi:pimeloyl-ACP methyl ester carboxylesterase